MREATWAQIGTDVREETTVEKVLARANLDYDVELRPVFTADGIRIPRQMAAVRTRDNTPFGIVSDRYKVVQNRDAFGFVNHLSDEIAFEKAGETSTGTVYIIARLPEKRILGDVFTPHVIFRNGFSGNTTIAAAVCPLRVVCQNQFNFILRNTSGAVSIRHMGSAEEKVVEARETIAASYRHMEELEAVAERYSAVRLSERQIDVVLDQIFPVREGEGVRRQFNAKREKAEFMEAYNAEDNANFRGTAWGMVNAYTDIKTHVNRSRGVRKLERKFLSVTMGESMNKIMDVIEAVI